MHLKETNLDGADRAGLVQVGANEGLFRVRWWKLWISKSKAISLLDKEILAFQDVLRSMELVS